MLLMVYQSLSSCLQSWVFFAYNANVAIWEYVIWALYMFAGESDEPHGEAGH